MKKVHKTILIFFVVVALILFLLSFLYIKRNRESIIFYYGDTCPHCKMVENYIRDNNIDSILEIKRKEVYRSQANAIELQSRAKECNIESDLGVPFIYYQGKCYMGKDECIEFLKNAAGLIKNG